MQPKFIINLGVCMLSLGLAAAAGAGERVTGEALHKLHTDKTWEMEHVKQGPGLIYFAPNGQLTLVRKGQTQEGRWWIHEGGEMRCHQFGGKPVCRHYESAGDGKYVSYNEQGGKEVDIHKVMDGRQLP